MNKYECPRAELVEFERETIMTSSICECGYYGSDFDMDDEGSGCKASTASASELGYNANNLPWNS